MADDGSDNPMLDMGLLKMLQPNKYIDQKFAGKPLALPDFYGMPTDAMGQPIGPPPPPPQGTTTLNAVPAPSSGQSDLQAGMNQGVINAANATQSNNTGTFGNVNTGIGNYPGAVDAIIGNAAYRGQANQDYAAGKPIGMPGQQDQSQSQLQQSVVPGGLSRQDYLDRLSAPQGIGGRVPVQGATVPQSQPLGVPSVMNAFLAAHPGGGTGPGNAGFFSTLDKLRTA